MRGFIFQQSVGWAGIVLLLFVLIRAFQARLLLRYPAFFAYIGYVLLSSVVALVIILRAPRFYPDFYWVSEAIAVFLGLTITVEVFRNAFVRYPGVRKIANILTFSLTLIAILRLLSEGLPKKAMLLILERDLRTVQALMFIVFAALVLYYAIPIGANLAAIALGYGLFISTAVFNLTLRARFGFGYQVAWSYLQPVEYFISVAIWCYGLWSMSPAGTERPGSHETYDAVSSETDLLFRHLLAQTVKRSVECIRLS